MSLVGGWRKALKIVKYLFHEFVLDPPIALIHERKKTFKSENCNYKWLKRHIASVHERKMAC